MENSNFNYNQPYQYQISLPNSTAVLVLGIVSIVLCGCYGIVGLACGIIAITLSKKASLIYELEPDAYTISSFNNMKAGRICAIIGTSLSGLILLIYVAYFILIGTLISSFIPLLGH